MFGGWAYQEAEFFQQALPLGLVALAAFLAGWLLRLPRSPDLRVREARLVTVLAYLLFSLAGSLAFWTQANWLDAFFESMSGFTTTGLSVLDFEGLPDEVMAVAVLRGEEVMMPRGNIRIEDGDVLLLMSQSKEGLEKASKALLE